MFLEGLAITGLSFPLVSHPPFLIRIPPNLYNYRNILQAFFKWVAYLPLVTHALNYCYVLKRKHFVTLSQNSNLPWQKPDRVNGRI